MGYICPLVQKTRATPGLPCGSWGASPPVIGCAISPTSTDDQMVEFMLPQAKYLKTAEP